MCLFIESIKLSDGKFFRLNYHQARLVSVFERFFKNYKPLNLSDILEKQDFPKNGLYKCRIVYDHQIRLLEFVPYTRREIKSLKLVETSIHTDGFKSENRAQIDTAFSQRGNCDDIIMLNNGFLSDASYSNIALWNGEKWFTPALPLIYGTQRAALLDAGKIIEKQIRKEDLQQFQRIRLFNAMVEFGETELEVIDNQ